MAAARRRRGRRRQGFEQSVPLVVGRLTTSATGGLRPVWLLAGLDLVAVLGLVLWLAFSPRFYVTAVNVVGASRVPEEEVIEASELLRLHILWVNGHDTETRILERLPSVERGKVSCRLPGQCSITVVERSPSVTWEVDGTFFHVDDRGGAFPADRPLEGGWLVGGPLPLDEQGLVEQDVLVGLKELGQMGVQPGRISYRVSRGLVFDDPAGWRVILGQGTGMESRLRVYAAVRAHLQSRSVQPRFVDVRFPEAPYYSEENDW